METFQHIQQKKEHSEEFSLPFVHSYAQLPESFFADQKPTQVSNPQVLFLNQALAHELGFSFSDLSEDEIASYFSGNRLIPTSKPISMAYAGHQFGYFVPQLGDGRAILLGELLDSKGILKDLQLKGAGKTPFSRSGDGRASLASVIREYVVSEAMHALGIPTSRSLAMLSTGDKVIREKDLPGGILTRVASSHIRIGTFEYFANRNDYKSVKILADYSINRHYPEIQDSKNKYATFLEKVIDIQAYLIARWMGVGFIHGVMNTDNMSISGETIDYGPCAFIDRFNRDAVFSSIDVNGRYAYSNQPHIAQWNLIRLAETLMPLIGSNAEQAYSVTNDLLNEFPKRFRFYWLEVVSKKIGLKLVKLSDEVLINQLFNCMHDNQEDFTNTFQVLIKIVKGEEAPEYLKEWTLKWLDRLESENSTMDEVANLMKEHNPVFIPRNQVVENIIKEAVENGNFNPMNELMRVLSKPYSDQKHYEHYKQTSEIGDTYRTFCGT